MGCNSCGSNPFTYTYNLRPCTTTSTSGSCCAADASTVIYTGPNLLNIGVNSNTSLQEALSEIDAAVGSAVETNWADFDYSCLSEEETIDSAQSFAETVSAYVCNLATDFAGFQSGSYADTISAIQASITAIDEQGLTSCEAVGIVETDNLTAVLTKLITNLCSVNDAIDPSGADWNQCYTVSPLPTTITAGFNTLITQICNLKEAVTNIPVLPTFDNRVSCLPNGGAQDSLYNTVLMVRDLACTLPTFDIDDLTWNTCIANPNPGGGNDITSALDLILQYVQTNYALRVINWNDEFFDVTYTDPENPCSGLNISLQDSVGLSDKLVALDSEDTAGYLLEKMAAGTNIEFDLLANPGAVTINSTAEDVKVKADAGDEASGYLIDKIEGKTDVTSAISLTQSYNATTDKVDITPSIDYSVLAAQVLAAINGNSELTTTFCNLSCACDCSSISRTVAFIASATGVENMTVRIEATQTSPSVTWWDSGTTIIVAGNSINTGAFTATSTDTPLQGTLSIFNGGGVDINYTITVLDSLDNPVSGTVTLTGTIIPGGTGTFSPFVYGNVAQAFVHIDLEEYVPTTTTTTTSTTTTTTTTT